MAQDPAVMDAKLVSGLIILCLLNGCSGDTVKLATYNALSIRQCEKQDMNTLIPENCYRSFDQEYAQDQQLMNEYREPLKTSQSGL